MGTQKNRLDETVLLSTQNICLNWWVRKISTIFTLNFLLNWPNVFGQLKHALYCVLEAWHDQDASNENHMKQFSLINVQRALLRDDYTFHLRNKFNFFFNFARDPMCS